MSGVNVNYNAFGTPGFFEGTKLPISYSLTINFKEIEYLLSNDWDPDGGLASSERNVARVEPNTVIDEGAGLVFGTAASVIGAGFAALKERFLNEIPSQAETDNIGRVSDAVGTLKPPKAGEEQTRVTIRAEAQGFFSDFNPFNNRGPGLATITQNADGKYVLDFDEDDTPESNRFPAVVRPSRTLGTFDTEAELNAFMLENQISTTGRVTFPPPPPVAAAAPE